jgi:predicted permease
MTRDDSTPNRPALEMPVTKDRIGRAVDDELTFHVDERMKELVAAGIAPDDARARAVAEFGDIESARRELRRIDELAARRSWLAESTTDLATDARRAFRALVRRPGYAIAATLTLALGIGANAAMFSLVDRLLLSAPPHIRNADEVVRLRFDESRVQSGRIIWVGSPFAYYQALTRASLQFDVAGSTTLALSLGVGADARAAAVAAVTPGYFALLGVRPLRGRFLADGDGDDARSVVISHALWSRDFAGATDVIGRELTLGVEQFRVVGIAPPRFTGDDIDPIDAWIALGPTTPGLPRGWRESQGDRRLSLVARPRPGVRREVVASEATHHYLAARAGTAFADSTAYVRLTGLVPGRDSDGTMTRESRVVVWVQGVSLLVLLIAIANVANLLLLRAIDRRRETAVAMALGVSRVRLVRHVLLESVLLGSAAALLGAALAHWCGPLFSSLVLPDGADTATTLWQEAGVVAALAIGSALALSAVPAWLQLRTPAYDVLRSGTRGASRRGSRAGDVLVVIQVACAVMLLVGSGLFVRSLLRLSALDLGFEVERVLAVQIDLGQARADSAATEQFMQAAEERARAVPGVVQTARSLTAPFRASMGAPVFLPGRDELPGVGEGGLGYPSFFAVTPSFFETMGLAILRGRGFGTADAATAPRAVIVDATMARTFWPNADALGQCLRIGADTAPCRTVVGVVQDSRRAPTEQRHALRYYLPLAQVPSARTDRFVFVRTAQPPRAMLAAVRAAAIGGSSAAVVDVFPAERLLDPYTRPWRLGRAVFVAFGVLSTVVATIGLYGVIAFGVAQRRRELGIRLALGAPRSSVLGSVIRVASTKAGIGCLVGAVGAFALGQRLRDLLFQTSPTEATIFVAAIAVVAVATLVASALPAWRAVRIDPTVSLRAE